MYKLQSLIIMGGKEIPSEVVIRLSDMASIPFAPDNTDYQAYLKWLAEGNEPLPPDQG
jgi:hypothetical protein